MAVGLDKRAASDVPLNQPFGFQLRVGVRHRRAMNAQHGRQLAARRDAVAGTQITGMHERAQLIAKLDVQRNVTLRLEMKWQHCLSPSAKSTRDWTASRANLSSAKLVRVSPGRREKLIGAQIQLIAALKSTDPGDAEQTRLDAYDDGATRRQLRIAASVH